jgi:enterochelin esterase-like enzyme
MTQGNRIPALQDTVKNIAKLATKLEPSGITIRFLNYNQDTGFDHLTNADDIELKTRMVPYNGDTRLGQKLQSKVVGPIMKRAKENALIKPVIVAIITDGEVRQRQKRLLV